MNRRKVGINYRRPDLWVRLKDLAPEYQAAARRAVGRSGDWQEIGLLCGSGAPEPDCGYGCKLYAAKVGAVLRVALFHSRIYGCTKGGVA